jgi:PadR family transcriptional regulator, regulatory protein PadR
MTNLKWKMKNVSLNAFLSHSPTLPLSHSFFRLFPSLSSPSFYMPCSSTRTYANMQKSEVVTMTETKSDLPQGTLDLLILKVIALGPLHGYAIAQRLQQVSRGVVQVPQGSLYPALHRLENRGLLAADWKETETGREAKFYRLTRKGRAQLETEAASWQRLTEAVSLILKMSEGAAK